MNETHLARIPWPGKSKPRPRVTRRGTYNPPEYTEWKENVAIVLGAALPHMSGNVRLGLTFDETGIDVVIVETERERFGRNDIDNLAGGVMDALQDAGVIDNDARVVYLTAYFKKGKT